MAVRFPDSPRAPMSAVLLAAALGCAKGQELPPSVPICGDGVQQEDELCDNGVKNSDALPDACRTTCKLPRCGDGVVDPGNQEDCDDRNQESGDGCSDACRSEFTCGNNECEVGKGESCALCANDCCVCGDMRCTSSWGETCETCPSECCPNCGNGVLDGDEACDDGNNARDDGCSPGCADEDGRPTCGNGVLERGEACDDGDTAARDGCSDDCQIEFVCGDDQCDAMAGESCRLCHDDCCPDCGNGVIDAGEACDTDELAGQTCTGACYDGGTLGCTAWCTYDWDTCTGDLPVCGDGLAECNEACDEDDFLGLSCDGLGFAGGLLTCSSACILSTASCGARIVYLNEGFDTCPIPGWDLAGDWECGTPTGAGPGAAYSAPGCVATQIDANYSPSQSYATTTATTPAIDLAGAEEPFLSYRAWVHTEGVSFDGYNLRISTDGGATFALVTGSPAYNLTVGGEPAWGGDQSAAGWQEVTADLTQFAGSVVVLRFAFRSDGSVQRPGVYLDDLKVSERATVPLAITSAATLPEAFTGELYTAALTRTGGSSSATWSIASGTNHTWLSIDPATGQLSGTPGVGNAGPVSVTVRVAEPRNPANFAEQTLTFEVIRTIYHASFEGTCPAGWTLAGDWECGVPTVGPMAAFLGAQCLATQIDASYSSNQAYLTTTATSPIIDLTGAAAARLSFRMWIHTEATFDGANLKISANGGPFQLVTGLTPDYHGTIAGESAWSGNRASLGWQLVAADLSSFVGQSIQLQFAFRSDISVQHPGVFIDDLRVLP